MRRTLVLVPLLVGSIAQAQDQEESAQFWGNVVFGFPRGDRFLAVIDTQAKAQYSGAETWRKLQVTPAIELYPNPWLDLVGEATIGRTRQSNDLSTGEFTPKLGARFHFLSNLRTLLDRNPLGRVAVSDLVRFEWRNFWYSDGGSSHETRFRNRSGLNVAINHAELSRDGTLYWIADFEFVVPLSGDVMERFATKRRTRAGLGYRRNNRWRFEALYIRDAARDTTDEEFDTAANIVTVRIKMLF